MKQDNNKTGKRVKKAVQESGMSQAGDFIDATT